MTPSPLQLAIGEALLRNDQNITVVAGAGCGKTSLLAYLADLPPSRGLLPPSILALAFNKKNAEDFKRKLPSHVTSSTFHALGFSALKLAGYHPKVDGRKCAQILFRLTKRDNPDIQNILKLVSLLKGSLSEAFSELIDHYELDFDNETKAIDLASQVLRRSNDDILTIDFDDMLHLPLHLSLPFPSFDYIFVDEAQDTNEVQMEILPRLAKSGLQKMDDEGSYMTSSPSRYVLVGDPAQAIYGFRGAHSSAMDLLSQRFSTLSLPLDVSYRCPQLIVQEANKYL